MGIDLDIRDDIRAIKNSLVGEAVMAIDPTSFKLATGGPILVFASGATNDPMTQLTDSETLCVRWNDSATPTAAWRNIGLPSDINTAYPISLAFECSKTGATLADATTLLVAAYITKPGDLHDADANCGGTTNAVTGDATAKTKQTLTLAIAAADIAASLPSGGPGTLALSFKPTNGTLGTDDFCVHMIRLTYTRRAT